MRKRDDHTLWRRTTKSQLRELERMRRMVSQELIRLHRRLRQTKSLPTKDECMAEVIRLSQVQMKLIPMEQALRRDLVMAEKGGEAQTPTLNEADWEVLEAAMKRRNQRAESEGAGSE